MIEASADGPRDVPRGGCDVSQFKALRWMAERDLDAGVVAARSRSHLRPAVFCDCDGVLNEEPGDPGVVKADDVRIIPGAGAALARARAAGLLTVAVTNRPQVARGLVTFAELDHILGRLEALLAEDGGVLDRIYACPHHPVAGFPGEVPALKIRCECRKPGTLLFRRAIADLPIDVSRSLVVGDSLRDIGAARGVGVWAYGVRTGYGCRDHERYLRETGQPPIPDLMFATVAEAVDFAIGYREIAAPVLGHIHRLIADGRKPVLVAVSGRARSGKSGIAHALLRCLTEEGIAGLHVRLDDWIMPAAERPPGASAAVRNRIDALPKVLLALRAGETVQAPGYDAATRGQGEAVRYAAKGRSVVLLDGGFATHAALRGMVDLAIFVTAPRDLQRQRFEEFYRWKNLDQAAIEMLWQQRADDEWPAVDAQQAAADLIVEFKGSA